MVSTSKAASAVTLALAASLPHGDCSEQYNFKFVLRGKLPVHGQCLIHVSDPILLNKIELSSAAVLLVLYCIGTSWLL